MNVLPGRYRAGMASSPAEAARGNIPARYARPIAAELSPDGRDAVVLLGTNEEPVLYPYLVVCHLESDGWRQGFGGNAGGFSWYALPHRPEDVGVCIFTDEAPPGATQALIRSRGKERRIPVSHGYLLVSEWDISVAECGQWWPEVLSFDAP
jgi:hypothetical protein